MIKIIRWRKRRRFAPLLSAVLPGLGQAVTARWSSACTFFILAAMPAFFMYYVPRELNIGHHIMFGLLAIAWVINIIDAYLGSHRPTAPCIEACPANIEIPHYINLILEGRYVECHALISRWTPLVGIIGHVCHHPCEEKCTRKTFDESLAICPLKAFVGKYMIDNNLLCVIPRPHTGANGRKVAIIGSGPAGLTAGFFMSRLGLNPTIFESLPVAGGMLAVGIPSYRLPRRILDAELDFIRNQGVEIRTGVTVGADIRLSDLFDDGYKAVFAAPGTHREYRLRVEGEQKQGVIPGLQFLRQVNLGELDSMEGDVIIVGGGNVAMDAARCALRLGASRVTVLYRRSRLEMPANDWEVREAEEEGVEFLFLSNPVKVIGGDSVEGIECVEMKLGEPDESGRRRPIPIGGSEFTIPGRFLIPAIGLFPDSGFLEESGVRVDKKGFVITRNRKMMTHRKNVFAGGDAVTGPASVIQASYHGREAAIHIHNRLSGRSRYRFQKIRIGEAQCEFATAPRVPQRVFPADDRKTDFRLIHQVYSDEESLSEGRRCLRCDLNM